MSSTGSFEPIEPLFLDAPGGGAGGGLSDPTANHYQQRRQVLDIVNRLHSYGLQHQLDLPQIAVVGSQSVGKSSLIEAISGIKLPRASGTCTRCPIECRLSRVDEDWQCEVYLRLARHTKEIPFGSVITDRSEVEDRIRRAQWAILNPHQSHTQFLQSDSPPYSNELSFSKDLISVRISGKDVDDLSFVDLPGIIASVRDGGRESDIEEVRSLVMSFIQKPSCLILLVISCETDIENQGARQLVKRLDPQRSRTIPVLTKPDRIAIGEQSGWVKLLNNDTERFKHGWYCVKQPDQQQIEDGITWDEARDKETEFFEKQPPWSSLKHSICSRLGTRPLTDALGSILYDLICKRLPGLLQEVEKKLEDTEEHLQEIPQQIIGEPVAVIWKLIEEFKKDVEQLIAGRPEDGSVGLIQTLRSRRRDFREAVFQQAPLFRPFDRPDGAAPPVSAHNSQQEPEPLEPSTTSNVIYIDEVLRFAEGAITRELPSNYPYAVKKAYVARFSAGWCTPAESLFREMKNSFLKELKQLVQQHFGHYSPGGLSNTIFRIVHEQLDVCSKRAFDKIQECIAWEKEEPITSNEHYLASYKEKYITRYRSERQLQVRHDSNLQTLINGGFQNTSTMQNTISYLGQMGIPASGKDDLLRILRTEASYEAMIEIMAEVRAYYQVAFKRFVDYIPIILDYELLKGFGRHLDLFKGLKLGGNNDRERCAAFLKEDPQVVRKRKALHRDLERFRNALIDLQNIPGVSLSESESELSDEMDLLEPVDERPSPKPVDEMGLPEPVDEIELPEPLYEMGFSENVGAPQSGNRAGKKKKRKV